MADLEQFDSSIIGQNLKEKYDFSCPHCNTELWAKPSIFMSMGLNLGGGSCTDCKQPFYLKINQDNTAMIAEKMGES